MGCRWSRRGIRVYCFPANIRSRYHSSGGLLGAGLPETLAVSGSLLTRRAGASKVNQAVLEKRYHAERDSDRQSLTRKDHQKVSPDGQFNAPSGESCKSLMLQLLL